MPAGAQGLGSPHAAPAQSLCVLTACRLPSLEPVTQKTKADASLLCGLCQESHANRSLDSDSSCGALCRGIKTRR